MHSLDDFISAREHLAQVLLSTKLIYSPIFSEESGNKVFIKPENLQKTGSFKIRGAYNKILKLSPEEKKRGVIASSGNQSCNRHAAIYPADQGGIHS